MAEDLLKRLEATIAARQSSTAEASYTKSLLADGPTRCAKKFGEEAVEFALAVSGEERAAVASEAADVLYHLLVALKVRDVALDEVLSELCSRMDVSGHVEKAGRVK